MRSRKLETKIEVLRREMEKCAMKLGFSHPQVYRLSLQLDQLHNQWQRGNRDQTASMCCFVEYAG